MIRDPHPCIEDRRGVYLMVTCKALPTSVLTDTMLALAGDVPDASREGGSYADPTAPVDEPRDSGAKGTGYVHGSADVYRPTDPVRLGRWDDTTGAACDLMFDVDAWCRR